MDDRTEEERDSRGRLRDRMLGTNRRGSEANTILHDTRYDTLPGMADTFDLKLNSRRESCSEPPYSEPEATLADSRSATAEMIPGRIPCLGSAFLPTVKDEPRPSLARLVQLLVERSMLFLR
jgi:hypothetical protein